MNLDNIPQLESHTKKAAVNFLQGGNFMKNLQEHVRKRREREKKNKPALKPLPPVKFQQPVSQVSHIKRQLNSF